MYLQSGANFFFRASVSGSYAEYMRITSAGNVGIGTSSPAYQLDIGGGTTVTNRARFQRGSDDSNQFMTMGWNSISVHRASVPLSSPQTSLSFNQVGSDGTRTAMFIDSPGNVGIGTSSPDANLTVNGAASFAAGTAAAPSIARAGDLNTGIFFPAADTIAFAEGGAEAMRIDSSGNLGLGVTPSAWGSIFDAAQIGNYGAFVAGRADSSNQLHLGTNSYYNGTNWIYTNTSTATRYVQASGAHEWHTAPSGTAGNAISFTQAMTLDASGNLGVGTTSPSNYGKLTVGITGTAAPTNATNLGPNSINLAIGSSNTDVTAGVFGWQAADPGVGSGIGFSREDGTNWGTQVRFYTHPTTTTNIGDVTERARITSGGDFGIGTTSPASKLGVAGDITLGLSPGPGSSYGKLSWRYNNSVSTGAAGYIEVQQVSAGNSGYMVFATNNNTPDSAEATERMRIDSAGNVGIGTTSPGAKLEVNQAATAFPGFKLTGSSSPGMQIVEATGVTAHFANDSGGVYAGSSTSHPFVLRTNNTERARIDSSGNLLVGTTSATNGGVDSGFQVQNLSGNGTTINIGHPSGAGDGYSYALFSYNNSVIGSIGQSGTTAVLYNVTSDYRLKTVVGPVANAGQRIDALQPVEYTWNSDGSRTRGFLAHQFQEVYAGSVSGTKDAVDAEGKPVYQSMQASTSEVIADLVAELQSLRARVAALESI
jgi:hypothetical protein